MHIKFASNACKGPAGWAERDRSLALGAHGCHLQVGLPFGLQAAGQLFLKNKNKKEKKKKRKKEKEKEKIKK